MTPELLDTVLTGFRAWLQAIPDPDLSPPSEEPAPIDLHTLLAQFIALRHEVNLQTKATRSQQEQNGAALEQLRQTLDALRESQAEAKKTQSESSLEQARPLVKALLDVHDALALAFREVQRVQATAFAALDELAQSPTAEDKQGLAKGTSFWSKWFGPAAADLAEQERQTRARVQQQSARCASQARQLCDSLLTGYRMSLQRIERALEQQGLEPIESVGEMFDPEQMEAVAVVTEGDYAPGTVVEELRPGYRWRGRVFRYAQVSVAKPPANA